MYKSKHGIVADYPELAKEWSPKNSKNPSEVSAGSGKSVLWVADCGCEWSTSPGNRMKTLAKGSTGHRNCPNKILWVSSIPQLVDEWHTARNGNKTPQNTKCSDRDTVWWLCANGHEFSSSPHGRFKKHQYRSKRIQTCSRCAGKRRTEMLKNSPLWHEINPAKNDMDKLANLTVGSGVRVWWQCHICEHEWNAQVATRRRSGCPCCSGQFFRPGFNDLQTKFPEIAAEWSPKNVLKPHEVYCKSTKKFMWRCANGHEWETTVNNRTKKGNSGIFTTCLKCFHNSRGWTHDKIVRFVASLSEHVEELSPAELFVILKASGLLQSTQGRILKTFFNGRSGENISSTKILEFLKTSAKETPSTSSLSRHADILETIAGNNDKEAIEFLIQMGVNRLWQQRLEGKSLKRRISEYSTQISKRFGAEAEGVSNMKLPDNFIYPHILNDMQKLTALRSLNSRRMGNWSSIGAGKTVSAILASCICEAVTTVVVCPNNVITTWKNELRRALREVSIQDKTFEPQWPLGNMPKFLILNYEMFQQAQGLDKAVAMIRRERPEFLILDEIHMAKHRERCQEMSIRRQALVAMRDAAIASQQGIRILGMSGTPVINSLHEGKTMVELISGNPLDIETYPTIANCMALHRELVKLGIRWKPNYNIGVNTVQPKIDCGPLLSSIKKSKSILDLELELTRARLPEIIRHIETGTIIYSHYITRIGSMLRDAIEATGYSVGFFTGDDKEGLDRFMSGEIDVLIGTSALGTGLDGLQHASRKLIFNALPWTAAEYDQIRGRLWRQGQKQTVSVVIPTTYANVGDQRWSWCEEKLSRLQFKRTIADAALDGIIPDEQLKSPAKMFIDTTEWLNRLSPLRVDTHNDHGGGYA